MTDETYYIPVRAARAGGASGFNPGRAAGWLALVGTAIMLGLVFYVSWGWMNSHIFGIGIEDAGQTTVNRAELLQQVRTFELVTVKDTYDSRSHTDFKNRLNAGFTKIGLPGWVAGQDLDVKAEVTVAAGVDLAQVQPEDIEVIQHGDDAVVVIRIPEAQVTSTEVDADTFDISTGSGVLTKLRGAVGLGNRDVRDSALGAVSGLAREQAVKDGILTTATEEARTRLQGFLQGLPQHGTGHVTYLVELQPAPAR